MILRWNTRFSSRSRASVAATLALMLALPLTTAAAPQTYQIDPAHTQVDFRWQHLGLSTPAASFDQVIGEIQWDAQNPSASSVQVSMPVLSVRTRVPAFDVMFTSDRFFDADRFPEVRFKSTKVERTGMGNRLRVLGDLTVKGITKPVTLDAVLNGAGMHPMIKRPAIGFDATAIIRRSEYGMGMAIPDVSDEIAVRITVEAIQQPDQPSE